MPQMNKYLLKIAQLQEAVQKKPQKGLQEHQSGALDQLDRTGGIILHHSTGSGKTKTFLTAIQRSLKENPNKDALVVAPASLVSNVDKEIKKHGIKLDRNRLHVYSYEKASRISDELRDKKFSIAVADEAHKLRNTKTKRSQSLSDIIAGADKRILSTGTANYNHVADIAPLLNIAKGERHITEDPKVFEARYVHTVKLPRKLSEIVARIPPKEKQVIKDPEGSLKESLRDHVSYYDSLEDPKAAAKFPKLTEEVVEVPMGEEQRKYYSFMEHKLPYMLRMKIRHNLPMDKQEKSDLNAFATGVRQTSNGYRHLVQDPETARYSPKIEVAVRRLAKAKDEDKNFRGLVYSNFLDAGVNEYSRRLTESKIKHKVYSGKLSAVDKDALVKEYNSGKFPVLVITSSGAEGLDLKGTKLTQVLEPHFNPSKIKQVIGRGRRYESHEHLPEAERKMHVEHYLSVHPKELGQKQMHSIDKYLHDNSDDKGELFDQIKELMKET